MNQKNQKNQPPEDPSAPSDKLFVDVPPAPQQQYGDHLPSGIEPMETIAQRGRAYRRISHGNLPWWIIIASWLIIGLPLILIAFLYLQNAIYEFKAVYSSSNNNYWALFSVIFSTCLAFALGSIPLLIIGRGTINKIKSQKNKNEY